jgi:hypothetical protein
VPLWKVQLDRERKLSLERIAEGDGAAEPVGG